jgi:hypothetical protein
MWVPCSSAVSAAAQLHACLHGMLEAASRHAVLEKRARCLTAPPRSATSRAFDNCLIFLVAVLLCTLPVAEAAKDDVHHPGDPSQILCIASEKGSHSSQGRSSGVTGLLRLHQESCKAGLAANVSRWVFGVSTGHAASQTLSTASCFRAAHDGIRARAHDGIGWQFEANIYSAYVTPNRTYHLLRPGKYGWDEWDGLYGTKAWYADLATRMPENASARQEEAMLVARSVVIPDMLATARTKPAAPDGSRTIVDLTHEINLGLLEPLVTLLRPRIYFVRIIRSRFATVCTPPLNLQRSRLSAVGLPYVDLDSQCVVPLGCALLLALRCAVISPKRSSHAAGTQAGFYVPSITLILCSWSRVIHGASCLMRSATCGL